MYDPKLADLPLLVDLNMARRLLGNAGRTTIFEMIRAGELEGVKLGRSTKVTAESIVRRIAALPRVGSKVPGG